MKNKKLSKGIALILLAATLACVGQLIWKLSSRSDSLALVIIGLFLYGVGALAVIVAFKHGQLSILHPMLSFGYVLSLFLGAAVLGEPITFSKVAGVGVVILGIVLLSGSEEKEES